MTRTIAFLSAALLFVALAGGAARTASAGNGYAVNYLVVFGDGYAVDDDYAVEDTYAVLCTYAVGGNYAVTGQYAVGCNYAVTNLYAVYAVAHQYAVSLVTAAGGTVVGDMLKQTGVMVVQSKNEQFANLMSSVRSRGRGRPTSASRPCPSRRAADRRRRPTRWSPRSGACSRSRRPTRTRSRPLARRRRRHPRHRNRRRPSRLQGSGEPARLERRLRARPRLARRPSSGSRGR